MTRAVSGSAHHQPEGGVESQSDEESSGEVGAEEVLAAFAVPGAGPELAGRRSPWRGEQRHRDQRDDRDADPDRAAAGVIAAGEGDGRVDGDVCGEQPEGDRDELLGASLGVLGSARAWLKRQRTMIPASASISESAPNAISATDPATTPAPIATAASIAVPREPEAREEAGAGLEPSPLRPRSRRAPRSGGVDDGKLDGHVVEYAEASAARGALARACVAVRWRLGGLVLQRDLGRSPRTVEAYAQVAG